MPAAPCVAPFFDHDRGDDQGDDRSTQDQPSMELSSRPASRMPDR